MIHDWWVVWNIWIIFPYLVNASIPTYELIIIFQRGVGLTTSQMIIRDIYHHINYINHHISIIPPQDAVRPL